MGRYSIKELEKLSGIKAHTIRIWEKRYRIIEPERTKTNIRYYSDDDLKKIINISLLNNDGVKISKIANLLPEELIRKVNDISTFAKRANVHVDQLIVATIDLDEEAFEKILTGLTRKYGFEETILNIIYPLLEKVGVLWHTNKITPAQEHFLSVLVRQKIIVAIDSLPRGHKSRPGVLLFLPEQELHELGLLFYHYVVKKAGFRTFYLGQMVPFSDMLAICNTHQPDILITSITGNPIPFTIQEYINKLSKERPGSTILVSGYSTKKVALKIPAKVHLFHTVTELKKLLGRIK